MPICGIIKILFKQKKKHKDMLIKINLIGYFQKLQINIELFPQIIINIIIIKNETFKI